MTQPRGDDGEHPGRAGGGASGRDTSAGPGFQHGDAVPPLPQVADRPALAQEPNTQPLPCSQDDSTPIGARDTQPFPNAPAGRAWHSGMWSSVTGRRSPRSPVFLAGLMGGVLVVFGLGLLVGVLVSDQQDGALVPGRPRPRDGPREVVQRYLQAHRAGDPDQAGNYLCKAARADGFRVPGGHGQDVFGLLGWQVAGTRVTHTQATVDVDLEVPIVGAVPLTIGLVDEQGQWRICSFIWRR